MRSLYLVGEKWRRKEWHDVQDIVLSIIIVNYHSFSYVKNCVDSIYRYNDIAEGLEVIIVDNSEDKKEYEQLMSIIDKVNIVNNTNKGFGAGNNKGVACASGKYLLFLNPDTELIEPVFRDAISIFEGNSNLGAFGFKLVDKDLKPNVSCAMRMTMGFWRTMLSNILVKFGFFIPKIMFTSGADLFIRKEAFDNVKGFDENIFMYCEEADILNRINNIGYSNAFFKNHSIVHYEGKTQKNDYSRTYYNMLKSKIYYCNKYGYNIKMELKKELRYCKMKLGVFRLFGIKSKEEEYWKILDIICHCMEL